MISADQQGVYITPAIFSGTPAVAVVSTRHGGVSRLPLGMNLSFRVGDDPAHVSENRRRLLMMLDADPSSLATAGQCHSNTISRVTSAGHVDSCDALVTDVNEVVLGVSIADCVPILLLDSTHIAVAAIHAGWRGSVVRVTSLSVERMKHEFGSVAAELRAYIGPSAGNCCYEVGEDVGSKFRKDVVHTKDGRMYLDLKKENEIQLTESGLAPENIEVSPLCTVDRPELFHSYRRDRNESGRMMAAIKLRGD